MSKELKRLEAMPKPIANHFKKCQEIAPNGYAYGGYDAPHYVYCAGNYQTGFKEMLALEDDLTALNLALMAKLGVTRT